MLRHVTARGLLISQLLAVLFFAPALATAAAPDAKQAKRPLYAFCFDIPDARQRDVQQQAAMLKQLGFDGAGHVGLAGLPERLATLDEAKLRLFLVGTSVNLSQDAAEQVAAFQAVLPSLKDRDVLVYVVLSGLPAGDPPGMDRAVSVLQQISDQAARVGVRIGIYPHTGDWVATVPQAVAVAQQVGRPNCGVIFNLCHFLRNEPLDTLDEVLKQAQPHLQGVTINGADLAGKGDPDWKRLIQPLDQGSFDILELLRKFDALGYAGPIGLMCYGIEGDAQEHLARSMAAWKKLQTAAE